METRAEKGLARQTLVDQMLSKKNASRHTAHHGALAIRVRQNLSSKSIRDAPLSAVCRGDVFEKKGGRSFRGSDRLLSLGVQTLGRYL